MQDSQMPDGFRISSGHVEKNGQIAHFKRSGDGSYVCMSTGDVPVNKPQRQEGFSERYTNTAEPKDVQSLPIDDQKKDSEESRSLAQNIREGFMSMETHLKDLTEIRKHLQVIAEANAPKYKPINCRSHSEDPAIEISTRILDIPRIKVDEQSCTIDLLVCVDWTVENKPDVHFPSGSHESWTERDWANFFNPSIMLVNAKPVDLEISEGYLPRFDSVPKVVDDKVHLKKTMRFCGDLMLTRSPCMEKFPFDIHRIPIQMKSDDKLAKLTTPTHRRTSHYRYAEVAKVDPKRVGDGQLLGPVAKSHIGSLGYQFLGIRVAQNVLDEDSVDDTGLRRASDEQLRKRKDTDPFVVEVSIARKTLSQYVIEIWMMQLMVILAATSLYDVAELSGRLSISMTILLTLAAFTTNKPTPIAQAEASTYHDWNERSCLMLVLMLCMANVISSNMCGGEDEEAPAFLQELYESDAFGLSNKDFCTLGWCRSRKIDCHFVIFFSILFFWWGPYRLLWHFVDFLFRKHKRDVRFDANKRRELEQHPSIQFGDCKFSVKRNHWHTRLLFGSQWLTELACRVWCFIHRLETPRYLLLFHQSPRNRKESDSDKYRSVVPDPDQ